MATLSKLFVEMGLKADALDKGLDNTSSKLGNFGTKATKTGKAMSIGITAPALVAAGALFKIGSDADSMADTIAIKTGATGKELEGLVDSATEVFKQVPAGMDVVAETLSALEQATGQSGKGLEDLTATSIRLADITGEDLAGQVTATTEVFKNWQVAAEDQVGVLDKLLIASQESGMGVTDIGNAVDKFGPQLRALGFDLDESIALIASLGKAGLDVNKTINGMSSAMQEWADAGKDPQEMLKTTFAQLKAAPTLADATALAIQTFGAKAGPGLAEAIHSGTLSFEELLATMAGSDQTVMGVAGSTDDAAQQFQILKNQVIAAAIPLATKLFEAVNDMMPLFASMVGWLAKIIEWFTKLPGPVQKVIFVLVAILAAIGPLLLVIGPLIPLIGSLSALMPLLAAAMALPLAPILLIIAAVALLFIAWKTNLFGFRDITEAVIGKVIEIFRSLVTWFSEGGLSGIGEAFMGVIQWVWDTILAFLEFYFTLPILIVETLIDVVSGASDEIGEFVKLFTELPGKIASPFSDIFNTFFNVGYSIISGLIGGISSLFDAFLGKVQEIIDGVKKVWDYIAPGSPSKRFTIAGKSITEALTKTLNDGAGDVARAAANVSDSLTMKADVHAITADRRGSAAGADGGVQVIFQAGSVVARDGEDGESLARRIGDAVVERVSNALDLQMMVEPA